MIITLSFKRRYFRISSTTVSIWASVKIALNEAVQYIQNKHTARTYIAGTRTWVPIDKTGVVRIDIKSNIEGMKSGMKAWNMRAIRTKY